MVMISKCQDNLILSRIASLAVILQHVRNNISACTLKSFAFLSTR